MFNAVADEYDRHRPAYPDELVDQACRDSGLSPGDPVLEVGCGTGQLTQSLVTRALRVTAVEPGERLIRRTRERVGAEVSFINSRMEEASLRPGHYRAAFSASAIQWVDPDVGWRRLADALVSDGSIALLSHFGLDDAHSRDDEAAFRAALARVSPELAGAWPAYRDLDAMRSGADGRRDNVSELWAWLGGYDVGCSYVTELFDTARLSATVTRTENTADQVNALLGTMSFWGHLAPDQRDALIGEIRSLEQRLGRPIRSTAVVCLVTARRRASP